MSHVVADVAAAFDWPRRELGAEPGHGEIRCPSTSQKVRIGNSGVPADPAPGRRSNSVSVLVELSRASRALAAVLSPRGTTSRVAHDAFADISMRPA